MNLVFDYAKKLIHFYEARGIGVPDHNISVSGSALYTDWDKNTDVHITELCVFQQTLYVVYTNTSNSLFTIDLILGEMC